VNDARKLALECLDALGDDLVGIQTAYSLDVVEEAGWDRIVVEGLVGVLGSTVKVDFVFVFRPGCVSDNLRTVKRKFEKHTIRPLHSPRTSSQDDVTCWRGRIRILLPQKAPISRVLLRYPSLQYTAC
jgi:hypothetical protein